MNFISKYFHFWELKPHRSPKSIQAQPLHRLKVTVEFDLYFCPNFRSPEEIGGYSALCLPASYACECESLEGESLETRRGATI